MITPPTDFEGGAWATSGATEVDASSGLFLGLVLLALLLGAVIYAATEWAKHAQKNRLLKIRQRKYGHIKKAAKKALSAPAEEGELQAAKLFETCRKHLPTATSDYEKLLGGLKKAADGADIEHARLKVARIDRSRLVEAPRAGYVQPPSTEVFVFDEVPPPTSDRDLRRERASKAIKGFFEHWVKDANGTDMAPQRLAELEEIQKSFAIDLPSDPDSVVGLSWGQGGSTSA